MTDAAEKVFITASPNVITRASRMFDNSLDTTLGELLQNSRRAGATKVEINYHDVPGGLIEYRDDGPGIFRQGFNILLGGSNWAPEDINTEDAAGMGIFSLCRRNPTIKANGIQVALEEDHFNGLKPVNIEKVPNSRGTSIKFSAEGSRESVRYTLATVALYFPLPVTLDSQPLKQRAFIERPRERWEGMSLDLQCDGSACGTLLLNFYGHVVKESLAPLLEGRYSRIKVLMWGVALHVDIRPGCKIQMVLPDRKSVVRNELVDRLIVKGLKLRAEEVARCAHRFSYQVYCDAKALLGVDIGEAVAELRPMEVRDCDEPDLEYIPLPLEKPCFVTDSHHLSFREVALSHPGKNIFQSNPKYNGYSWYDALPKIQDFDVLIAGKSYKASKVVMADDVDEEEEGYQASEHFVLLEGGITVAEDLQIWVPELSEVPVSIPIYVCGSDKASYFSDIGSEHREQLGVIVNEKASIHSIVDWLGTLTFESNEDSWSSPDEQKEQFDEEAYAYIGDLLGKQEEAAETVLRTLWNSRLRYVLPPNCTITLKSDSRRDVTIEIQKHPE